MKWQYNGVIMRPTDFQWAAGGAIGDAPLEAFKEARGSALVQDNKATWRSWSDIDPTVVTDKDGTS